MPFRGDDSGVGVLQSVGRVVLYSTNPNAYKRRIALRRKHNKRQRQTVSCVSEDLAEFDEGLGVRAFHRAGVGELVQGTHNCLEL